MNAETDLRDEIEKKRAELARALFSPQAGTYPLRNSKNVLRLAGELVGIAALLRDQTNREYPGAFGDK